LEDVQMDFAKVARLTRRGLVALAFAIAAVSLTLPHTAYARHGNGAGIALGILGGAIAGAAIAGATAPGYYAAPPGYYYPYPPQVYAAPPAYYYYAPPPTYYGPPPYYGPQYYYGGN
jgi:hypothetical protein